MIKNKRFCIFLLICVISLLFGYPGFTSEKVYEQAVKLEGNKVLTIKKGVGSFSTEERADAVSQKILKVAQDYKYDPENLTVVETENSSNIVINDIILLTIDNRDAALEETSRQKLAQTELIRIKRAIKTYRKEHRPKIIIRGLIFTILSLITIIMIYRILNLLFTKLHEHLDRWNIQQSEKLYINKLKITSSKKISFWISTAINITRLITFFVVFYWFLVAVLGFFPYSASLSAFLSSLVYNMLYSIFHSFANYLPNLIFIIITVGLSYYTIKAVNKVFTAIDQGIIKLKWFYPEWSKTTKYLFIFFITALAFALIYPHLPGAGSAAFQGVSIFVGVVFSLGSSRLMSNIMAGIILTYTRAFHRGERIRINEHYGDVVERDMLVTRIRTIKNEIVSIPNSKVLDSDILNYSKMALCEDGLILHTEVTIGYNVPRETVESLLISAALDTECIRKDKQPFVFEKSLNDYHITYEINAYTNKADLTALIYSELHRQILTKFDEANVEIMSPSYFALRDGNPVTIPPAYLKDYKSPYFNLNIVKEDKNA